MTREAPPIDAGAIPELARLVKEVSRTRQPRAIQQDGEVVALLVPAGRTGSRHARTALIDTSRLPPLRYRTLDELLQDREAHPSRAFTWEEIKETVDQERADAWRTKYS